MSHVSPFFAVFFCFLFVCVVQAEDSRAVIELKGHTAPIKSIIFSPDGTKVVTDGRDAAVKIWDAESGKLLHTLQGSESPSTTLAFSPDGTKIVTAITDGTAKVWETDSGKELQTFDTRSAGRIDFAAFFPDGKKVLTPAGSGIYIFVWSVRPEPGERRRLYPDHTGSGRTHYVTAVAFAPDGEKFVTAGRDGTVQMWETDSENRLQRKFVGGIQGFLSVAYSPDGKKIVTAGNDRIAQIWDADSRVELKRLPEERLPDGNMVDSRYAAFSPDGKKVVTTGFGGVVRIWDAESGEVLQKLEGHKGRTNYVDRAIFLPDGKKLVTAGHDKTIRVWEVDTGKELQRLVGYSGEVRSVALSPDGKKIVFANTETTAQIWDLERLPAPPPAPVYSPISPNAPLVRPAITDF